MWTTIKAYLSLNLGRIPPLTSELVALEGLKKTSYNLVSTLAPSFLFGQWIFILVMTCWLSGERSLPFGLLVCICENKDADQLCIYRDADQSLCFRHMDSAIPLLSKSEISVFVQPGLCPTWSETLKTGFLTTRPALTFI